MPPERRSFVYLFLFWGVGGIESAIQKSRVFAAVQGSVDVLFCRLSDVMQ